MPVRSWEVAGATCAVAWWDPKGTPAGGCDFLNDQSRSRWSYRTCWVMGGSARFARRGQGSGGWERAVLAGWRRDSDRVSVVPWGPVVKDQRGPVANGCRG